MAETKQTYEVSVRVDGRYQVTVRAASLEEARVRACEAVVDADFGELECIEWEAINAADEEGNIHDYI
jgi:hypothetical protein